MPFRFQSVIWLLVATRAADAAVIAKANNAIALNLGVCWVGNIAPGMNDVASFDANPTSSTMRSPMTTDLSWGGISVSSNSPYGCRFGVGADVAYQFSLGASGINAQGTTSNNRAVVMTTDLLLAADQIWTGASGASVSLLGTSRVTGSYVDLGGRTLTVNGIAVTLSGNNTAPFAVKNGVIQLNSGASLTIDSGSRPTGTSEDPDCEVAADLSVHVNAGAALTPRPGTRFNENLHWNAQVVLNGGRLDASGYTGFFAGSAEAYNNTVGGSIQITAASSLELSSEITAPNSGETLHKITAPISGGTTLSIKNSSKVSADNVIVLAGDNSGFTGAMGLVADTTDGITSGRVRLATSTAATPGPWTIAAGNTLEIAAVPVTLGPLSGAGTVTAVGGGESTVTVAGTGNFTGTVTAAAGSVMHFRKTGTGTHSQLGTIAWNGHTTVAGGKLAVSKATLADSSHVILENGGIIRLTHGATDQVAKLIIDGVECAAGTWGKVGSGAAHESDRIESDGLLQVGVVPPASAFESWIDSYATALPAAADRAPGEDPDGDGFDNFAEFAFAGDPTSAAIRGFSNFETSAVPRFVVAVRDGASFSGTGELVSDPVDGVVYHIQASTGLADFTSETVLETPGFTPSVDWPSLPDGWSYRCFETTRTVAETPQQFLRALAVPES